METLLGKKFNLTSDMALNEVTTHIMKSEQKHSISYQSCIGNIKVEKSAYKEQEFLHISAIALKTKKKQE